MELKNENFATPLFATPLFETALFCHAEAIGVDGTPRMFAATRILRRMAAHEQPRAIATTQVDRIYEG